MKIEVGKYYVTEDGQTVGPMYDYAGHATRNGTLYADVNGDARGFQVKDGARSFNGWCGNIIAEYQSPKPEVGTLAEIGAQVWDVVAEGENPHQTVVAYNPDDNYPWVLSYDDGTTDIWYGNSTHWRIISRANPYHTLGADLMRVTPAKPSPVRTVTTTRKEIVSGQYGIVNVDANRPTGNPRIIVGAVPTPTELTAAIATLTAIRDALGSIDA